MGEFWYKVVQMGDTDLAAGAHEGIAGPGLRAPLERPNEFGSLPDESCSP